MDKTGIVRSIKYFVGSDIFNMMDFLNHIISRRIISMQNSKDDIIFIKLYQLSIISSYGTGMKVAYLNYDK